MMKRVSHQSNNTAEFKYDALEINEEQMQVLSHKQQLQVLNELVNLRTAVKKMASSDERWVEVIQKTILSQDELSMFKANSTLPLAPEPNAKKDFQDQSNQTLDLD